MRTNIFGFEAHDTPLGDRFLHATIVPTDDGHLTIIEVESERRIVYRRALRFSSVEAAREDLTTQLRFMETIPLDDLQRIATPTDDGEPFTWTTHRDLSAKLKKEEAEEDGEFDTHVPTSIEDPRPKLHYLSELSVTMFFVRQAGSTENYLQTLGVQPDVIQFVSQQPTDVAKKLVNEVRKNNNLTVQQLQEMAQGLASKQKYEPTQRELQVSRGERYDQIPGMSDWVLLQLKRHRGQRKEAPKSSPPYEFMYTIPATGEDFPCPLMGQMANDLMRLLLQIADWVRNTGAQLSSYDLNTAKAASDKWHEEQAAQGAGQGYQESNVVYTFKNGWTIQLVRTENDLQVEGNLMGHCVGGYCEPVALGNSIIYSLRDQKNEPHATIEVKGDTGYDLEEGQDYPYYSEQRPESSGPVLGRWEIVQIQGKENQEPIPQYKAMIKEWFQKIGPDKINFTQDEHGLYERIYDANFDDIAEIIERYENGADEYGLKIGPGVDTYNADDFESLYERIIQRANETSRHYRSEYIPRLMDPVARSLADAAWDADVKKVRDIAERGIAAPPTEYWWSKLSAMAGIQRVMDQHHEKFLEFDPGAGLNPDDYETEDDFFAAEQRIQDEQYGEWTPGGMDNAITRRWNELGKHGLYPWLMLENLQNGRPLETPAQAA